MEHPYLPGLEPNHLSTDSRRKPRDRLFLGFLADEDVRRSTTRLADRLSEEHGLISRPLSSKRRHVSLAHLGDYKRGLPQKMIWATRQAAERISAAPFDFTLDRVGSFASFRPDPPIVLCGSEGLERLLAFHAQLCAALAAAGLDRWVGPGFNPHMTLFYDRQRVDWRPIEPIAWRAQELVLIHSVVNRSIYNILGTWPLILS
jgi:2'-5' RNA ligase